MPQKQKLIPPPRKTRYNMNVAKFILNWICQWSLDISGISSPSQKKRSEEHTSELQSPDHLVCRLLLEKKNQPKISWKEQVSARTLAQPHYRVSGLGPGQSASSCR